MVGLICQEMSQENVKSKKPIKNDIWNKHFKHYIFESFRFLNLFWSLVIIASICLSGWFVYTRFDEFLK